MKIAIPVGEDKKTIFKKTGRAPFFAIFQDAKLDCVVPNAHANGEHSHHHGEDEHPEDHAEHVSHHAKDIEPLRGCDVILVQAVGEHMQEALDSVGIKVQKIRKKDGITAEEAVNSFLNNK